jgi:competence protein ComFA
VIELEERIKSAFPSNSVTSVYGGHTSNLEADIILLTCHQLYRYEHYFDLLIIDETDAFPYQGNEILHTYFNKSLKGNFIMMSATPLPSMIKEVRDT